MFEINPKNSKSELIDMYCKKIKSMAKGMDNDH